MTLLGSKNPNVQHLRRLSGRRSARTGEGLFVIDGPVLVDDARSAGIGLVEAFVDADATSLVRELALVLEGNGVPVHHLAAGVLASAVDTVTPNGIAAIARRSPADLTAVAATAGSAPPLVLVLAGVADPGNAGTLLRSAVAAGASVVITTAGSVDLFSPKAVRASAGALFHVPAVVDLPADEAIAGLHDAGVRICGTRMVGGTAYDRADLASPVALVLGNEAHGLDETWAAAVGEWLAIPMAGPVESLNVAMAGTVVCFEAARQRRTG